MQEKSVFELILSGELDSEFIYEDEEIFAINDINPVAKVHILIIPKRKIETINDTSLEDQNLLGKMILVAKDLAKKYNINKSGYRLITNCESDGGQEIPYLHFHLVGGLPLGRMIGLQKNSQKLFKKFKEDKINIT